MFNLVLQTIAIRPNSYNGTIPSSVQDQIQHFKTKAQRKKSLYSLSPYSALFHDSTKHKISPGNNR